VQLTGANMLVHGRFPATLVTGSYALDGLYHGIAPEMVQNGKLTAANFLLQIDAQ
jgi:hypothetical protein